MSTDEEPLYKKVKYSILSEHVFSDELEELLTEHWHNNTSVKTPNIEVVGKPFKVVKISNLFNSENFIDEIKTELVDIKCRRHSIDLYQFEQSADLANVDFEHLSQLYHTFRSDIALWLEKITRIELNRKISISSCCYSDTDYLLCHDDNMGDRRIAFIYYLTKNWTADDGGALDIFDTDENGWPRNVVRSFVPEYNSLIFFEVVDNSYHQVAEVTSPDKARWSINGWFHGPVTRPPKPERPLLQLPCYEPENTQMELVKWVSKYYLFPKIIDELQKAVEKDSYTFLGNFLKDEVYAQALKEITSDDIVWSKAGPADLRNYEVADEKTLPETLKNICKLFKSINMFQLLKRFTHLDLVPVNETTKPKMSIEVQRWCSGCYFLIETAPQESQYPKDIPDQMIDFDQTMTNPIELNLELNLDTPSFSGNYDAPIPPVDPPPEEEEGKGKKKKKRKVIDKDKLEEEFQKMKGICFRDDDDSDISDIGDYLSDPNEKSSSSVPSSGPSSVRSNIEEEENNVTIAEAASDSSTAPAANLPTVPVEVEEAEVELEVEVVDGDEATSPIPEPVEPDIVVVDESEDQPSVPTEPGALDVIMQFHTDRLPDEHGIDYVAPDEKDAAIIHIPPKDNHLCLVYKTSSTCRIHRYIDHYYTEYFYNLICTYYE
ncbi:prolyl 3-hydroxylase OGFOD1 [Prorops nasuta]|uniref:prolyl 3-hydroxylase OGFOD1 n=1 Tax=Prorops nasuta TaxID=863751 RepID=UPI0034CE9732